MKASDVIREYEKGERNFRRLNLRGANFKQQNLSGADFSYCQLQGTNFSEATLTGANFTGAKAGLQKRWVILLLLVALVLIVCSSLFLALAGFLVTLIFDPDIENQVAGWASSIILIIFCVISFRKNLGGGLIAGAVAGA
ncbi:MAG TPA: hypothetical protein DCF68_12115, partial [Cyanothece sp. UBA12306]|nr:hypothetical protein [Cyanothece sp. UBA12306]